MKNSFSKLLILFICIFICSGSGYKGSLPDINMQFEYKRTSVQETQPFYRTIDEFDKDFLVMVSQYLKIMSPYRRIQDEISRHVKSLGGSGKIHGSIVDIDFYNHIMINPIDGKITYYYSPVYGEIETFKTLKALLEKHNKEMVEQYIKYYDSSVKLITPDNEYDELSEIIKIDIKNSVYTYSNKINQIQRLFEKKILRDWNDDLLSQGRQESDFYSIDNIYLTSCLPNQ